MKKTSRRSFAKTMTAALAAAPVVLASKTSSDAQTPSKEAQVRPTPQRMFYHQDTPPPIEILDGSLIVESAVDFQESPAGGHFHYTLSNAGIEHIRVIADNGDKIYEDLDASEGTAPNIISSTIELVWTNEDNSATGIVKITGGSVFQIDSDKKLDRPPQPPKKRRKFRYEHPGNVANKRIRIESIEITNPRGRKTKFTATPTGTGDQFLSDEFRILIWH